MAKFLARGEYTKGSRNIAARVMSSVKSGVGLGRSPSTSANAQDATEAAQKDFEGEPADREVGWSLTTRRYPRRRRVGPAMAALQWKVRD